MEIKIAIGSAKPYDDEESMEVKGRNLVDGLPKSIIITAAEVREAMNDKIINKPDIKLGRGKHNIFVPYEVYENLRKASLFPPKQINDESVVCLEKSDKQN